MFSRLRLAPLSVLAAVLMGVSIGQASASTTITRWQETQTFSGDATDECRGIDNGSLEGTAVFTYRVVETFNRQGESTGYHVMVIERDTLTFAFPDGSYGTGEAISRYIINFSERSGIRTFTQPHVDSLTVWTADGQVIEHLMFHEILHFTRAGDTVYADVERGHLSLGC